MPNRTTPTRGISDTHPLTENPTPAILKTVPGSQATRHDSKQTKGGNDQNSQPPLPDGFFMSAISGDCTELPGVVDYKIPSRGKVHSVSFGTLRGTRQLYCCPYSKQSKEEHAMQTANTHATGAPAPTGNGRCLLHSSTVLHAIVQAKTERHQDGRGNAYGRLLQHFHRVILPSFLIEAGSVAEASRLLGIHRGTLAQYLDVAGIDVNTLKGGAV